MLNGMINVYKEAGFTSHDVVAKLRGICGQKRIGHTGTLDPQATGVLPVCLGNATRLCDMLTDRDKEYVAELLLGVSTDTQDVTGRVLTETEVTPERFTGEEIRAAIMGFAGSYAQIPPMYSALKVGGRKLCDLAREGREVERKPREVMIYELEILSVSLPVVKFRAACSKGTYMRTLCADIGERLGCGGTMRSLVRTRAAGFLLQDALKLKELQERKDAGRLLEAVIPVDAMFADAPALHIREGWRKLVENGNAFMPEHTSEGRIFAPGEQVRVYREDDRFAGIYAFDDKKGRYQPVKMFLE